MPRILFVCTANLYRSPLLAALFAQKLQSAGRARHWIVESAGTWAAPGQSVPVDVLITARSIGIDLKTHKSRRVDRELLASSDLILVMERGHREALRLEFPFVQGKIHLLSEVADGLEYDIADPANSGLEIGEITAELCRLMDRAYPGICQLVESLEKTDP